MMLSPSSLELVVQALHQSAVVAYPTEAVFGLGCDPDNEQAVESLLLIKQRPKEKGLILVAANYQQLLPYIDEEKIGVINKQRMQDSWPGPTTWIVPIKGTTPRWLTGEFDSLAVRVSAHPLVQQLCLVFGKPVVSTSANLSGLPPCKTVIEVKKQFGEQLIVLSGEVGASTNPSAIRDVYTGEFLRRS